jgi:hypothetical protein
VSVVVHVHAHARVSARKRANTCRAQARARMPRMVTPGGTTRMCAQPGLQWSPGKQTVVVTRAAEVSVLKGCPAKKAPRSR